MTSDPELPGAISAQARVFGPNPHLKRDQWVVAATTGALVAFGLVLYRAWWVVPGALIVLVAVVAGRAMSQLGRNAVAVSPEHIWVRSRSCWSSAIPASEVASIKAPRLLRVCSLQLQNGHTVHVPHLYTVRVTLKALGAIDAVVNPGIRTPLVPRRRQP